MSRSARPGKVGVLVPSTTPPERLIAVSKKVEDLGFDELWMAEDYFFIGGIASAAMALQATTHIQVGLGIVSAVVRHPAVTAMEISTLARAFPGRLLTGIGHGVPAWTRQMGLYPTSPVTSLRVVIETTRRLLAGETLTIDEGPFLFDAVTLTHPAVGSVELYAGVIGPKSLELAGEIADGTVMSVIAAPEYLRFARRHIAAGAERSGRDPEQHQLPTYVIYHVDTDGRRARETARAALAFYLSAIGPTPMTGAYGINDELTELLERQDLDKIAQALPEEWVEIYAIAGTPQECAAKIGAFHEAGATSVVLAPFPADDGDRMLELTASAVLPLLRDHAL
jgi:5,10-methylenetetrahydromethanopterin reductase